jgi:fatty-acyl-CoA synthase/long-chain acyl-CoA synthetase
MIMATQRGWRDISEDVGFQKATRKRLLGEGLSRNAVNFPAKLAIHDIESGWRLTFAELENRANHIAHGLLDRGLTAGDRICILGRNYVDTLVLYFAVAKMGAIAVPLNYYAIAEEQRYILADSAPRMALVSTECAESLVADIFAGIPVFTFAPDGKSGDLAAWIGAEIRETPLVDVADRAPAFILYTGGTTGRPKGVALSQAGYVAMAESTIQALAPQGFGRSDSWLILGPLYHGAAIAYSIIGLHYGQAVHLMREYNAAKALDALSKKYGTVTWFIPTMSRRTVDYVAQQNIAPTSLDGLRIIISAGAPLSLELRKELGRTFRKCQVIDILGQTEMTSTILVHAEPQNIERAPTAVGLPTPGVAVALLDERNVPVQAGEIGELCYLGESLMLGYWNKPEATAEAMAGGWFHSGDLARRDEDGIIFIAGRKKDLIKSGGENVIPNEIEDILRGVQNVSDACVLGLADDTWGERVHAVLAIGQEALDAEKIRAAAEAECRAKLSRFKIPKSWTVVAALPANTIGKCDKAKVRELVGDGRDRLDIRAAATSGQERAS